MYRTIRMILRYDTIYMIHTLYLTIHEYLQYADMIRNFLHMKRYVLYDTDNYDCTFSNHGQYAMLTFMFDIYNGIIK